MRKVKAANDNTDIKQAIYKVLCYIYFVVCLLAAFLIVSYILSGVLQMNYCVTEYCSNFLVILINGEYASIEFEAETEKECADFIKDQISKPEFYKS